MNEYNVRLHDGRLVTVFAYTRADIGDSLAAEGIERDEVAGVRLIEKKARAAKGFKTPRVYGLQAA
jgi:hypothetical protein